MPVISRRLFLFGASWASRAQETTFSANVNVVSLLATVRDREGRVVKSLDKDDFVLAEDGKPQTIRYFSRESDLPLTIGLLVDTSRSQIGVLERERNATYQFLSQVLRENVDRTFVVAFDRRVQILQGMTSSRQELAAALARLRIPQEIGTQIYEGVRMSSETLMRKQTGRKAFVLLTDGVSYRDDATIGTAIEFAQRADTILYTVRFSDEESTSRPGRIIAHSIIASGGRHALKRMASETGGTAFEVSAEKPIEKVFSEIEEALRNQYSIGYTPARARESGKFHKIKLTTNNRTLAVVTREGYYS